MLTRPKNREKQRTEAETQAAGIQDLGKVVGKAFTDTRSMRRRRSASAIEYFKAEGEPMLKVVAADDE